MADAEHLPFEVILAARQQDVVAAFDGLAQGLSIEACWCYGSDGRAAVAISGKERQAKGAHGGLAGAAVTVVAGKNRLQPLVLHQIQGSLQGEVEVDRWGEGVAIARRCFAVALEIQIKLRQIGLLLSGPGPLAHGHKAQARRNHVALL